MNRSPLRFIGEYLNRNLGGSASQGHSTALESAVIEVLG